MPNELLLRLARTCNALTQRIGNEVSLAAETSPHESLHRAGAALARAMTGQPLCTDTLYEAAPGASKALMVPAAVGYKAGARVAFVYEQSAKFLFGRGERHASFSRNDAKHRDQQFVNGPYQQQVAMAHHVSELVPSAQGNITRNNFRALKQDGVLGIAVKALAAGLGNIIGAAFCGSPDKAADLEHRVAESAHAFNAVVRSIALGTPMAALVLTGVTVGLAFGAVKVGFDAIKGAVKQARQHDNTALPAPASTASL